MLQCIGFASWREGERGQRRGEARRRGNHRRAAELRQDRYVQVYGCMIGWQSVSLHLFSPRLLLIFSLTHTRADDTVSHPSERIYRGDLCVQQYM